MKFSLRFSSYASIYTGTRRSLFEMVGDHNAK